MDDDFDDEMANFNIEIPNVPKYNMILPPRPVTTNAKPTDKNEKVITPVAQSKTVIKSINKSNCILVNAKQRGNPLLKAITNIPWEYDEIVADYVVGVTACILFLSLRYHTLNPDYINQVVF
jgi:DNA excision repair protein ERCC-1